MFKLYVKRKRAVVAAVSAVLVASAFQPVSCNLSVDPQVLSSVVDALSQAGGPGDQQYFGPPPFGPGFNDGGFPGGRPPMGPSAGPFEDPNGFHDPGHAPDAAGDPNDPGPDA
ncbi:MAG: hypothetical protein ACE5F9_13505 [Phycisphaerae bacterium]